LIILFHPGPESVDSLGDRGVLPMFPLFLFSPDEAIRQCRFPPDMKAIMTDQVL